MTIHASDDAREKLAAALADGDPVDWDQVAASGEFDAREVEALRALEGLRSPQRVVPDRLAPGREIGGFRLLRRIGQGGMGDVWAARQLALGREVALKFMHPERVDPHHLALFAREARAGGRLNHPGIVTVHGQGESEGLAWIAMELVPSARTLSEWIRERVLAPTFPPGHDRECAQLLASVAEAIHSAHEAGVIHRDLKPQNVLLTTEGKVKVSDFGVARVAGELELSRTGEVLGTYFYMSPEQVAARRAEVDARSDVFALGVVLYEMLALRRPFQGDTSQQIAHQVLHVDPPDLRTIRSRVPADLAVIAARALEKERQRRYPSCAELAADLRRHLAHEPIHARPPTLLERFRKWIRRHPGRAAAIGLTGVALLVISALLSVNVRTNRALTRTNEALATANAAAERSALEAQIQAELATTRAEQVLRLSELQRLENLVAEAEHLWPAQPENVDAFRAWIEAAETLVGTRAEHAARLSELRSRALPKDEALLRAQRERHPRQHELGRLRRERDFLLRRAAGTRLAEPEPAELGIDWEALPADTRSLLALAGPLVDPVRGDWGHEAKGLLLARRALALAAPEERPEALLTLAWAFLACGQPDEGLAAAEEAVQASGAATRAGVESRRAHLERALEESLSPTALEQEALRLAALEERIARLEREISAPEWRFADAGDQWWHDQLEQLVAGIDALADEHEGLLSHGNSELHGWGVRRRLGFALELAALGAQESQRELWLATVERIADVQRAPQYHGLRIAHQIGLVPLGPDPASGLEEFAHLASGEPPRRAADGTLELDEESGIVLVLLPGGPFLMGSQGLDPRGAHYVASASPEEGPVHTVELTPFFLAKHELTQGQWLRFAGANPSHVNARVWNSSLSRTSPYFDLRHPVESVNWISASQVLSRMGLLLPSEAQWEYGARGGTSTAWWFGDEAAPLVAAGNVCDDYARGHGAAGWGDHEDWDDGNTCHAPVGSYRANPFGLHDMIGNVWEWCRDAYATDFYARSPRLDPVEEVERAATRVWRGGGFNELAHESRSGYRAGVSSQMAAYVLGLRAARALDAGR